MIVSSALTELIRPGRHPLGPPAPVGLQAAAGPLGELADLLAHVNGFTTANGGVQVFRAGSPGAGPELAAWNAPGTWKDTYGGLADGLLCFGQDLFGVQFAIEDGGGVVAFDPETADREPVGAGLDDWARWLLADLDVRGARAFAAAWQDRNGPLDHGTRLVPRRLFVFGGDYDDGNLVARDAVTAMRGRGPIAARIHDLPDRAAVRLVAG